MQDLILPNFSGDAGCRKLTLHDWRKLAEGNRFGVQILSRIPLPVLENATIIRWLVSGIFHMKLTLRLPRRAALNSIGWMLRGI